MDVSFQRIALPLILATLLITLVNKPQRSKNVLGVGEVSIFSYSIYLFHPIVLAPFSLHSTGAWFIDILIFMGSTVLVGWIGYHSMKKTMDDDRASGRIDAQLKNRICFIRSITYDPFYIQVARLY